MRLRNWKLQIRISCKARPTQDRSIRDAPLIAIDSLPRTVVTCRTPQNRTVRRLKRFESLPKPASRRTFQKGAIRILFDRWRFAAELTTEGETNTAGGQVEERRRIDRGIQGPQL
jgi:hypothetical protein